MSKDVSKRWVVSWFLPSQEQEQGGVLIVPCVYLLASRRGGTLYVGSTGDLAKRVWEHKSRFSEGFTKDYGVDRLMWYEVHETMESAQARELAIKRWKRAWKVRLIEEGNPRWEDLYGEVMGVGNWFLPSQEQEGGEVW